MVEFSLTGLAKEREKDLRSAWLLSYEAVTTGELERHAGHVLAAHALRRILDKPSEELLFFLEKSMGKIGITREALRAALDLASRGLRPEEVLRWALQSGSEARPPVTPAPKSPGGQQFKWEVNFADDGTFTLHCHYLPDESRSFTVTGKRVGPDGDFRRARKALLDQITARIRPLFPALDSTHIVAKAWSGVHRVYPSEVYGRK